MTIDLGRQRNLIVQFIRPVICHSDRVQVVSGEGQLLSGKMDVLTGSIVWQEEAGSLSYCFKLVLYEVVLGHMGGFRQRTR